MMIKIYSAADLTEAHIVSGMLRANNIEAHVGGHYLQGGIGELAAMDFACVYIDENQLEEARPLINDYEKKDSQTSHKPATSNASIYLRIPLFLFAVCILLLALALLSR